jgi:hypothetical protein
MRTESRRPWKLALLAALAALGTSCEDVRVTVVEVATLTVTPAEDTLSEGDTLRLRATLRDASGNSLPNRAIEWTSEDAGVAAVERSGLVRGLSRGTAVIRASSEGATGEASITVLPRASAGTSRVEADSTSMMADGSSRAVITVELRDSRGVPIPFGGDDVALSTTLGSLSGVTDHDDGTYTARLTSSTTPGTATLTGTVNGEDLEDDARVELVPEPPVTITITITAGDDQTGQGDLSLFEPLIHAAEFLVLGAADAGAIPAVLDVGLRLSGHGLYLLLVFCCTVVLCSESYGKTTR